MTKKLLPGKEKIEGLSYQVGRGKGWMFKQKNEALIVLTKLLELENKHAQVVQNMVDELLPKWKVKVECPTDWHWKKERKLEATLPLTTPPLIYIPWYTLRSKRHFFNATVHGNWTHNNRTIKI